MRICMVTSVPVPPREGIGYYIWNLSGFLRRQGHKVQIITRRQRGKPFYEELESFPIWRPRFYPTYPFHVHLHRIFVQRLVQRLDAEVDIFHLHTPLPPPIHSKHPRLVTVHTPMAESLQVVNLRALAIRLQMPVSIQVERRLFADAQKIVVVAKSVGRELRTYGLSGEQVEVFGNAVDVGVFYPGEQAQSELRKRGEVYVLAASRLDVRKGLTDLLNGMSYVVNQFPTVRLYIAGGGPLEHSLRAKVSQLALDRTVRFLGHVGERSKVVQLYRNAVIFAHAAHYEGLPTVLLEAMACGKAVVSTAVSGALDVVTDGINGLLVPPRAPEKLAEAICCLLEDADLRTQLGMVARRTVVEHFSWETVGNNYLRCYQALLNGVDR